MWFYDWILTYSFEATKYLEQVFLLLFTHSFTSIFDIGYQLATTNHSTAIVLLKIEFYLKATLLSKLHSILNKVEKHLLILFTIEI